MKPLVRNAALNGYVQLVRSLRADPVPLLRSVGLDAADLAVHNKWIPAEAVAELLELSAAITGCKDFGMRLAEGRRFSNLGPISLAAREEPDVRSALAMFMRYQHLHNEALRSRLTETNGLVSMKLEIAVDAPAEHPQATELTVGTFSRIVQSLVGDEWAPVTACFTHAAPTNLTAHQHVLGPSIRFGDDWNGLVMYESDLDAPNRLSDPLLRPFARQIMENLATPSSTADIDRIRDLIEALLPTGRCSLQQVARSLAVDRKTVHRVLARSDETFSSVLNDVRRELARQFVGQQSRPLAQVTHLLGFSAQSAFSRWFRTEFGDSPRAWRTAYQDIPPPDQGSRHTEPGEGQEDAR